ncbi:MAG: aldo/keto reductase [Pseudomonadota bacterium]|nr:aldo/keto reductase [Pseudomonadota bacterium]
MKRRDFIKSSVALPAAAALGVPADGEAKTDKARVRSYRKVGRTEIQMSDISCGTGRLPSASLVLRAIDRGVNYFDTAPDYGRSEEYIGEALKKYKQRDKIYIASKFCHDVPFEAGVSHLQAVSGKADYKSAVQDSLKRLNTDYLDVVFVHAIGELGDLERERSRLLDEDMLAAADELKREGKIRYLAVSSHGPNHMEELLMEAVRSGHFDLIMPAFNFMKFPRVPQVLKEAKARGVGVVAMKTLAGAKDMELDPGGALFEHAAFKWVLSHPEVAGLVVTMKRVRDIDLYLQASGEAFTAADQRTLERYAALYGNDYCRTGCGDCEPACPAGVPVASILRYQMYFERYEEEKRAMQSYDRLGRNATECLTCAAEGCVAACPHGLPVALKLRAAHEALSFSTFA